jgi:two-component system phosphate regulon response regulator PhoB
MRHTSPPLQAQFDACERIELGNLTIDFAAHRARWRGKPLDLGPNEFRLLAHFAEHPDRVHSRRSLIATLGKGWQSIDERTVDVWIGRLRRALGAQGVTNKLRTVRSVGYVYDTV